jgi:hypothetical protein
MADRSSDNAPSSQLKALIESLSPQRSGLKNDIGGFNRQRGDSIVERNKYSTTTIINSNSAHKTREISNPARNQDLPSHIINILRGFSERSVNFNLLSNLDTSLDRACLTIATGAALGALGLALLYKATNLVAIQTLRALREDLVSTAISNEADTVREEGDLEAKDIAQEEQINLERALDAALEKFTVSQLKTSGDQGIVVDLVGIVVSATDDAPIAGALVKCSEFGICKTGDDGRFMFANIPLGASYTITVKVPGKSLKPQQISGICGELGFIRVRI